MDSESAVRRGAISVCFVVLAALLIAQQEASAAVALKFRPTPVSPGEVLSARTLGRGMEGIPSGKLQAFIVRSQRIADSIRDPSDPRLESFGQLIADRNDVGHLRTLVPNVQPGTYTVVLYCRECPARSPRKTGVTFTAVGKLQISALHGSLPETGLTSIWIGGLALLLSGLVLLRLSRP